MADENRLDIILFGATGYTGKYGTKNLAILSKQYNFTWGIAGRNITALQATLEWASKKTGDDLKDIPIIIADLNNETSILTMAKKCQVILNCVGPYTLYGEKVVKACIEAKTHHLDISGEPYFMEYIQYEYNEKAKEAETYIVSACGIEVLPQDMGVLMLQDKFKGEINAINGYINFEYKGEKTQKGAFLHSGTWESAILIGKMDDKRKLIFQKLYPTGLKQFKSYPNQGMVHKFNKHYGIESIGPDNSVVPRSQQILYELTERKPIPFRSFILIPNYILAWLFIFFIPMFLFFTKVDFFVYLLTKFPRFFSLGKVSKEGPLEEELENFYSEITLRAEGFDDETKDKPKVTECKLNCKDPAYNMTSIILIMAGIMLIKQKQHLPAKGGVFTPGALFYKTSIMQELEKNGLEIKF